MKRAILLCLACSSVWAHADRAADFKWFGGLGFPDVRGKTFVRYVWGWSSNGGNAEMQPMMSEGFLLDEAADKFRVRTLTFETREFSKVKRGTTEYRYEPADLRACAEAWLQPPDPHDHFSRHLHSGPVFAARTELFVLAWMCARQGLDDLAGRLYATAEKTEGLPGNLRDAPPDRTWPFRHKLERDLGQFETWRAMLAFGDPHVTRRELLATLNALPKRYPHFDYLARVRDLAERLRPMIAEEKTHPRRTADEIAKMPPAKQAREWIFQLRDQNGRQMGQPGWVDIFMTADGSPAHRLAALGEAAVPALIAALDDRRLTRSVGYRRDFFFSHEIVTVGAAAHTIIERIAGRRFSTGERAEIEAWWHEHQTKGALGEMSAATARGADNSAQAGAKLLAEFPNDAGPALLAGGAAAQDAEVRSPMMRLIGKLQTPEALAFLLREVRVGTLLGPRAEAAYQLAKLGRPDAIAPLAAVWREPLLPYEPRRQQGVHKLLCVLALTDSPEGIAALAEGLRARTEKTRHTVIEALAPGKRHSMWFGDYDVNDKPAPVLSAPTQAAIEDLLAAQLEDTTGRAGLNHWHGHQQIDYPRLCDAAAEVLAARWKDRYEFDWEASFPIREKQRIACLNTWRKAHDLPPLPPPPERPRVASADAGRIAEVVLAGENIRIPKTSMEHLLAAKGRPLNAAFFREIESTLMEACGGTAPPNDQGFVVEALRENDGTGVTLIVRQAERRGLALHPEREWRMDFYARVGERGTFFDSRIQLFSIPASRDFGDSPEVAFGRIESLSAEQPFAASLEIAPQRWDADDAY